MAKWALMDGNNVLNVWDSKPTALVHPDILKECVTVPATVKAGDVKDMFTYSTKKIVDTEVQADLDSLVSKSIISSATKTKIDNLGKVAE
jgi:pantothenate kinase type III